MGLLINRRALASMLLCGALSAVGRSQSLPSVNPPATNSSNTTVVELPVPLLPTNDTFVADTASTVPSDPSDFATIFAEDGLKRTETRLIKAEGWVRAYQFVDATGAFAAYTTLRAGGRPLGNDHLYILPKGEIVSLGGVSVVRVNTKLQGERLKSLLSAISTGLPKIGGRRGLAPLLPTLVPTPGLVADSLRYALGPVSYRVSGGVLPPEILAWDKSAEVATADYAGKTGKGTLTMLLYPTPQIAGDRGRAIEQAVHANPVALGTVLLRRVGPLVGVTSGTFTPSQAQTLLDSLHLNTEVSFDKPMPLEFHVEVRKTATLLQQIAIFCGVGILAALVLGVFLGGARAGIRVLQGKPAASEPEFLRIDLRGRPQPIHPSSVPADDPSRGS